LCHLFRAAVPAAEKRQRYEQTKNLPHGVLHLGIPYWSCLTKTESAGVSQLSFSCKAIAKSANQDGINENAGI
jgi:hypothetical protein